MEETQRQLFPATTFDVNAKLPLYKPHLSPYLLSTITANYPSLVSSSYLFLLASRLHLLSLKMSRLIAFLALALILEGALGTGELVCEELPSGMCSFAIASSGRRCVLETLQTDGGDVELQCKTSEVIAMNVPPAYIETDECVSSCGLERKSVGISSDSLLETRFALKLCSPQCYYNCPNIVDLYQNLALAEGVFLADLCKFETTSSRRSAIQLQSSGAAASGPVSAAGSPAYAPTSSTTVSSDDCAPSPI